jgi:hypothetical protein
MRFDYLARPGLAQTTNALRVLELVGLPAAPPPAPPPAAPPAILHPDPPQEH